MLIYWFLVVYLFGVYFEFLSEIEDVAETLCPNVVLRAVEKWQVRTSIQKSNLIHLTQIALTYFSKYLPQLQMQLICNSRHIFVLWRMLLKIWGQLMHEKVK